jgi:mRNA interferase MazF
MVLNGNLFPKRGEIYWVDLDPTKGRETQKTRPGLVLSSNTANRSSDLIMIAPITSQVKNVYPFEVRFFLEDKPAKIMLNQCRAVDKVRLFGKIGKIALDVMDQVEDAIRVVFGLI